MSGKFILYEEKRGCQRIPVSLKAVWEAATHATGHIREISLGGCYVESIEQPAEGDSVQIKVHLPTGQWIDLQGEVTHKQWPIGFGLRFTAMSREAQALIAQLIAGQGAGAMDFPSLA